MDGSKQDSGEGPLSSEELARDEWRGDEAPGHGRPTGEADGNNSDAGQNGPDPMAGTMLPPD